MSRNLNVQDPGPILTEEQKLAKAKAKRNKALQSLVDEFERGKMGVPPENGIYVDSFHGIDLYICDPEKRSSLKNAIKLKAVADPPHVEHSNFTLFIRRSGKLADKSEYQRFKLHHPKACEHMDKKGPEIFQLIIQKIKSAIEG